MILSVVLLAITAACYLVYKTKGILWGRNRQPNEPQIVKGHPIWGNGKDFDDDSVGLIVKSTKEYGSVFTLRMLHYHMTIVADPHSFEAFSKEKSFDFDPIQKQVNGNIFGFQIPESRQMIKFVGKTTRGSAIPRNLYNFSHLLNDAYAKLETDMQPDWNSDSLDHLANKTLFKTIFNSIFGADKESPNFNYQLFHNNFKVFHKYFSYLWLGLPHCFFPEATKAVSELFDQPTPTEFMNSGETSEYLKAAIQYLKSYNSSDKDIKCHNLVFMHINTNTFKIAFWCLYQLMAQKAAMTAVKDEIDNLITTKKEMCPNEENESVTISAKDIEELPVLDSLIFETFRMASGVFMVRHNQHDVDFKVTATDETYRIRAGDKIMMYPPAIHKDPEIFEEPESFKYDRFINKTFYKSGLPLKTPVLPFGSICPGRKIALLQTKWYLITMLNKYDLELKDGESTDFDSRFPGHEIVPPTNDVQLRYRLRKNPVDLRVQDC